jgi:PKD repeat protein
MWNFGDSISSGATNPTYTWSTPGTYTVVLTSSNGCGSDTATYTITIEPLGLDDAKTGLNTVDLYPNPAGLASTLYFSASQSTNVSVKLMNTLGEVVFQEQTTAHAGNNQQSIDLTNLPIGIYFLQVSSSSSISTKRLVIAR